MDKTISEKIREITLELTSQSSVVETDDEVTMSEKVFEILRRIGYFRKHPEYLYDVPVENDPFGRKIVVAILRGEKNASPATVVFIGHTDTVGVSDYGQLACHAQDPAALAEKLRAVTSLSEEVRKDLESGSYLFGRGIFDMKTGDANVIALLEEFASDIGNLEGNILFGAVCDEEGNSRGMLTFVPELVRLRDRYGFDYRAILDPDYIAPAYPGDPSVYLYTGTVGKLMPTFLAVGRETHVGESFDGLDPNLITAEITRMVDLNPAYADAAYGEVTLPPVTLKQRDLKPEYSVQIASKSVLFFNYATHSATPEQVMKKMMEAGAQSFRNVISALNERYRAFCRIAGREFRELPWKERTVSYQQLCDLVRAQEPGFDHLLTAFAEEIHTDSRYDVREKAQKIVEYVHSLWADKDPVLIVYLTPPYYPHITADPFREDGRRLTKAVENAAARAAAKTAHPLVIRKFLPCISDLSYAAAPKEEGAVEALKSNMPGFGTIYDLPLEDMRALDLPVADIGSYGKDAHKFTERVETDYSFRVLPEILRDTVLSVLQEEDTRKPF